MFAALFGTAPVRFAWGRPDADPKQYELLMFIHERVRESGIPPSFDEMKDALDLSPNPASIG